MKRSKLLAVAALALAVAVADASVALADPLSKREWRKEVRAICSTGNADVNSIAGEMFGDLGEGEQPTDDQLAAFADQVVPIIEDVIEQVDDLEEPKSYERGVNKWLSAIEVVAQKIEDDPTVVNQVNPFKKPNKLAKKLGLRGCV
jgi:hypothetical protein